MRDQNCEAFWKEVGTQMKLPNDAWRFQPSASKKEEPKHDDEDSFNQDSGCLDAT